MKVKSDHRKVLPAGNHGYCIPDLRLDIYFDEYSCHDSLQSRSKFFTHTHDISKQGISSVILNNSREKKSIETRSSPLSKGYSRF